MDGKHLHVMMLKKSVDHSCKATLLFVVQWELVPLASPSGQGIQNSNFFPLLITSCFSERLPTPVLEDLHEKNPEK